MTDSTPQPDQGATEGGDLSGSMVGRFHIRARLGAGGMGEVYRADDTKLKRLVALKRMSPQLRADAHYRRRFLQEAERASALSDAHIAGVYDVLEQDGEIFLVMEHVEGQTLRQRLAAPLSLEAFGAIAIQCAEALVAAHQKDIIHRDIKPSNIMLTPGGQVKVLDFGVAKRLAHVGEAATAATETSTAGFSGTPAYMAPETLREEEADGRSDIFSLGIVFYEALTRHHPFRAPTFVATVSRILDETPPPPSRFNPHVPPELDRILERMLAKRRSDRYATAAELLLDLRAWQAGQPVTAPRLGLGRRLARHRRAVSAAGVVLTAVLLLLWALPSTRNAIQESLGLSGLPAEKNVVVLPFANVGGDPVNQPFCDGLTYTLTSKLTQLEQFHGSLLVVPASEVFRSQVQSVEEARKLFGVSLALTGSVQRTAQGAQVSINLVDARRRRQLRSLTLNASATDPSALQGDVTRQVARLLELELEPKEDRILAAGLTGDVNARDFYLQGVGYLQRYERSENIEHAIAEFRRALQSDPGYAAAYAGLGSAYWRKFQATKEKPWVESARQACRETLRLDAQLADGHVCLGTVLNGTGVYEQAVAEFQSALESDPTSDPAYRGLAGAYESLGRLDQAEATYKKAIALRPGYWGGHQDLGRFYYRQGRYPEAEAEFRRVIELTPDNVRGYYSLGALYHLMGRTDEAIALLKHSLEIEPTEFGYTNLGTLYFFQGRYREAVPMLEKATALAPNDYRLVGNLADAYRWASGDKEKAGPAYERAIALAKEQLQVNPRDPEIQSDLAVYWAKLGQTKAALATLTQALHEAPEDVNILYKAVVIYHLAGQRQRAVEALLESVQAGYSLAEIRADPELAEVRQDPKFQAALPKHE